MLRGTRYFNKEIKVENGVESAKIVTKVQTFRDFFFRIGAYPKRILVQQRILPSSGRGGHGQQNGPKLRVFLWVS